MDNSIARSEATHLSLDLWKCEDGQIRVSSSGQPSVFDMIKVLGGQKNPRDVWARLTETHPEVVGKCDNLKFSGRGQRETPVARTKEDAYYILGLLPGAVGRKYRDQAAKLFVAYLEDPAGLADQLTDRLSQEQRNWLEARLAGKRRGRYPLTQTLKEVGVTGIGYALCTNAVYEPVLGANAKTLKQQLAAEHSLPLTKVKNPRDHMNIKQLGDLEVAERIAAGQVKRSGARGNKEVPKVVRRTCEYARKLLDGEVSIPGL